MTFRRIIALAVILIALLVLAGCQNSAPRIPPASQFQIPAVGTSILGGYEETIQPELPSGQSGALFINQTGFPLQVAVSNTITTLPIGQGFLFMLPAGSYEFYIYGPDNAPRVHAEKLEDGKLRYLYISRIGKSDN
jgi:hypothetical protein